MALRHALPRARTTPERGTFIQDPSRVQDDDLAARRSACFTCPRGHEFTVLFADKVVLPTAWECRRHSIMAGLKDTVQSHRVVKKRSHWDRVLERRPRQELAQLLNQQLKDLRGWSVYTCRAMAGNERRARRWLVRQGEIVLVRLTGYQVKTLLEVAKMVDGKPGELGKFLPEPGRQAAFRGAMRALEKIQGAME